VILQAILGKRPALFLFGTDYPTKDGTNVRDYIHVEDLATAHLNSLDYLRAGGKSLVANAGYGHGYSVREVLSSVEKIAGTKLDVREEPRRAGDPPSLVAKCDKVRELLKWQPRFDDIDTIVRTSLEWEKRLQREPW
jgi:UDP-glucose 4-epimerase